MILTACPKNWSVCRVYGETENVLITKLQEILDHPEGVIPSIPQKNVPFRFIQPYTSRESLYHTLKHRLESSPSSYAQQAPEEAKVCFLFTGQGAQWPGMAQSLCETFPAIAADIQDSITYLLDTHNIDLRSLIDADAAPCDLNQTLFTQPAMVLIELALSKALLDSALKPDYLIGHSVGEIAASHYAGFYTKHEVLNLIAHRARLMQSMPPIGSMLACKTDRATIEKNILNTKDRQQAIQLAGINSPNQTILSGQTDALATAQKILKEAKIRTIPLSVSHAFHSQLMAPMLPDFKAICDKIPPHFKKDKPQLILNIDGEIANNKNLNSQYWCSHIIQPVHFLESVQKAWSLGCRIFVEVGPQPVLTKLAEQSVPNTELGWFIPCLNKKNPVQTFLTAMARLEEIS